MNELIVMVLIPNEIIMIQFPRNLEKKKEWRNSPREKENDKEKVEKCRKDG